jgi:hypothetical protein
MLGRNRLATLLRASFPLGIRRRLLLRQPVHSEPRRLPALRQTEGGHRFGAEAKLGVRADGDASEAALAERTERLRSVASECETGASDWLAWFRSLPPAVLPVA